MNSVASEPLLIGLDWGTTSFRAYLIGAEGAVLHRTDAAKGILNIEKAAFDRTFDDLLGDWLGRYGGLPVVASGMITSRNGWVETPYIQVPGGADELAGALVSHKSGSGTDIHFVTGMTSSEFGVPDVMRGEETQIVGAAARGHGDGVFVLPGTHSKWACVENGRIANFATFMTGEVFAALKSHTILGTLMTDAPFSRDALLKGASMSRNAGPELLHSIFSARTMPLFGLITHEEVQDYLSGLLIASEIQSASRFRVNARRVSIIGTSNLAERYACVLGFFGLEVERVPDDIVAYGHFQIADVGGLLR